MTVVGPLIDSAAADRVMARIDEAEEGGAGVLAGGSRMANVVEASLLENVPAGARPAFEEVFGPVLTLALFRDLEAAVARVHQSLFGL